MEKENSDFFEKTFKEVDLKIYYHIIRDRLLLISFITIAVFIIVGIKTFTMTPIYEASADILIEQNRPLSLFNRETRVSHVDPSFLPTQYEIIKSTGVLEKTIATLKLDTKYKEHFFGKENAKPSISEKLSANIKNVKKKIKDNIKKFISKNEDTLQINQTITDDNQVNNQTLKELSKHIAKNLSIIPLTNTKIVRFVYTDKDPNMATLIANSLVEAYKSELMEIKLADANYSLQWMQLKADEERKKLQTLEIEKQTYAKENDILTIENRLTVLPEKLEAYNSRLTEAQSKQHQLNEVNKLLQATGGKLANLESIPLIANNPVLQNIQSQLVNLDRELAELSKKYGSKHPRMLEKVQEKKSIFREKQREIKRITQSTEQEYALAKEAENNIQSLFQKTKTEAIRLNEKLSEYERMNRELETGRTLYNSLVQNMKEASARTQEKEVNVWVSNKAFPPKYPDKPNKKINMALALILGATGGIGFAFLLEYLDDTIKSPEDIERFRTPVLGIVEKVRGKANKKELLIEEGSFSTLSESYKIIRSSVLLSSPDSPAKLILITSTEPGDGKTTTTINFARSLAMLQESKVLVIDCDLRKPRLHSRLKIKYKRGQNLSSFLAGITPSPEKIIIPKNVNQPFDTIAAGPVPPNPSELISSARMVELLPALKKKYDFVILDSPPLFGAIDGLNISTLVDGTILVVRGQKTTKSLYGKVVKRLHSVDSRILGTIINGTVITKENLYHYAGYYASYGRYGDDVSSDS